MIPDLYKGTSTTDYEEASHLMDNFDWPQGVDEIGEVADYLQQEGHCESLAVMGFSMGGVLTVAACTKYHKFNAGVVYYGMRKAIVQLTQLKYVQE